jgi:hypothetical protein
MTADIASLPQPQRSHRSRLDGAGVDAALPAPEIFREVLLILRARARAEEAPAGGGASSPAGNPAALAGSEEESAL